MVYFRARDSSGIWSHLGHLLYFVEEVPSNTTPPEIIALEYFLQVDTPYHGGFGIPLNADTLIDQNWIVHTLPEESGERIIYMRALSAEGNWGLLTPSDSFTIIECELVYNTLDTGLGSFRFAVNCADPGDSVQFDQAVYNQHIILQLPRIDLEKDLVVFADTNSNITLTNADSTIVEVLISTTRTLEFQGVNLIGQSGDSFWFLIKKPLGGVSINAARVEKIHILEE